MKQYYGVPKCAGGCEVCEVLVDNEPLKPRYDLRNHSPDGYQWGYGGSGPAQLALALLADCVGDEKALRFYQPFKWQTIANLPRGQSWHLDEVYIRAAVRALEKEKSYTK